MKDLIAVCSRHEILRFAQDDTSAFFTVADAFAKSIWPVYLAFSAAMTPPMSLTDLAPVVAMASEGGFLNVYLQMGLLDRSPFESLDTPGVGALVEIGGFDEEIEWDRTTLNSLSAPARPPTDRVPARSRRARSSSRHEPKP